MDLRALLAERRSALFERWLDAVLAEYGEVTAARWRRERDPFANPVGYALAKGLPRILDSVLDDEEPSHAAAKELDALVKIRSVQQFTPSRAVGFVSLLRGAIREELAAELAAGASREALALIEQRIERFTLLAFDAYVRSREQMFRIREGELRRSVASLLRRFHGEGEPEPSPDLVRLSSPREPDVRR